MAPTRCRCNSFAAPWSCWRSGRTILSQPWSTSLPRLAGSSSKSSSKSKAQGAHAAGTKRNAAPNMTKTPQQQQQRRQLSTYMRHRQAAAMRPLLVSMVQHPRRFQQRRKRHHHVKRGLSCQRSFNGSQTRASSQAHTATGLTSLVLARACLGGKALQKVMAFRHLLLLGSPRPFARPAMCVASPSVFSLRRQINCPPQTHKAQNTLALTHA